MSQERLFSESFHTEFPLHCPELLDHLSALENLELAGDKAVIAAIGDYNVGKSSLLNALIGEEIFTVADRRETRELNRYIAHGVCWLDSPGLEADHSAKDDQLSQQAMLKADMLLVLHNINNGDLSPQQLALLQKLRKNKGTADMILILTRIDECSDLKELEQITLRIRQQTGDLPMKLVSSQRFHSADIRLQARSGVPELAQELQIWIKAQPQRRQQKIAYIKQQLYLAIQNKLAKAQNQYVQERQKEGSLIIAFTESLKSLTQKYPSLCSP